MVSRIRYSSRLVFVICVILVTIFSLITVYSSSQGDPWIPAMALSTSILRNKPVHKLQEAPPDAEAPRDQPPHIVLIIADDYGFNDIGYRNPAMKTPNMDALAAEGVILDNYYVQPICTPSRAQLMSGRYLVGSTVPFVVPICILNINLTLSIQFKQT